MHLLNQVNIYRVEIQGEIMLLCSAFCKGLIHHQVEFGEIAPSVSNSKPFILHCNVLPIHFMVLNIGFMGQWRLLCLQK